MWQWVFYYVSRFRFSFTSRSTARVILRRGSLHGWRKPVHTSWSRFCTVNHRALASNCQLSNMKYPGRDLNRRPQRLKASTLIATPPSPLAFFRYLRFTWLPPYGCGVVDSQPVTNIWDYAPNDLCAIWPYTAYPLLPVTVRPGPILSLACPPIWPTAWTRLKGVFGLLAWATKPSATRVVHWGSHPSQY